ncbi:MAG TPA: hypothetical protein VLV30_04030 [Methanomicrobiales archaeon]|nr:hypothetical protein [Methanomicrobiales archaeon]
MAPKHASILILLLFALALGPGCASSSGGGGTSGGTQGSAGGQASQISPGPVVTVPEIYMVEVQENRNHNPIHPDITVAFRGGKGQIFVQKIVGTVVRSDGQVITKELDRPENGQLSVGDSMTFQGTTGVDRVIVVVTILGKDYKVLDMQDDYNSHP